MKQKLIVSILLCILISAPSVAQSQKNISKTLKQGPTKALNTDHIGAWKLVSQKITYANGQIFLGDSTNVFQRLILTPTACVVIGEAKIPDYDNKKLAISVAGGHYTLVNGNYQVSMQYASYKGFETMKVDYKLTMENGKLHMAGTVTDSKVTIYDEVYVRED
jgi:hypothetical protein